MTSPYLDAALARCRLPVTAQWNPAAKRYALIYEWVPGCDQFAWHASPAEATAAYLRLVREMQRDG